MTDEPTRLLITADPAARSVSASGDIDAYTAPDLATALAELGTDGDVMLDLGEVGFIDSSGLRVIMTTRNELDGNGHSLRLRRPSAAVLRLLEITGLAPHLQIDDNDEV